MNAITQQKLTRETIGLLGPVLFEPILNGGIVLTTSKFDDTGASNIRLKAGPTLSWRRGL